MGYDQNRRRGRECDIAAGVTSSQGQEVPGGVPPTPCLRHPPPRHQLRPQPEAEHSPGCWDRAQEGGLVGRGRTHVGPCSRRPGLRLEPAPGGCHVGTGPVRGYARNECFRGITAFVTLVWHLKVLPKAPCSGNGFGL